jgi:hypothetical protein
MCRTDGLRNGYYRGDLLADVVEEKELLRVHIRACACNSHQI